MMDERRREVCHGPGAGSSPHQAGASSALTLLVIAGTLNYVDRAALSIANPLIREELGLSIADMGLLLSAFLWAYAFSQLLAGR